MVSRLLTVPFHQMETATSFVSRLAARNTPFHARDFCSDMGLSFQKIVDGDEETLTSVATLGQVPAAALIANAIGKDSQQGKERVHRFRGQRILRKALRRRRTLVCPACLIEDVDGSDLSPLCAVYGRWLWSFTSIRTCSDHQIALVEIDSSCVPSRMHDVVYVYRPALPYIHELAARAPRRSSSEFETYLTIRLGQGNGGCDWLDSLGYYAASKFCEVLGAIVLYGRMPNLDRLTDNAWVETGQAGYEIASKGETHIRDFLRDLQKPGSIPLKGQTGARAYFGRLFQWLSYGAETKELDPVRDLFRRHILETLPYGPGEILFGKPVEKRIIHSVRTVAVETGLHPKRLRKILAQAGLVAGKQTGTLDAHEVFDAEAARAVIATALDSISLLQARQYLNMPPIHAQLIVRQGWIQPMTGTGVPGIDAAYARSELDRFLARLLQGAVRITSMTDLMADIPSAIKRTQRSLVEIVGLILDGKLQWVGQLESAHGYLSVLVDIHEVKELLKGPEHGGLSLRLVELELGLRTEAVKALIALGCLRSRSAPNPVNRRLQTIIDPFEVERFEKEYVTLAKLSKERRMNSIKLKNYFERAGVQPAFAAEHIGRGYVYRRHDIVKL